MKLTTMLGLDYLAGWVFVLGVRLGWWHSLILLGKDQSEYNPVVYFDGTVDWRKKKK